MSDASSFEAEYNRMLDGFATLINQQQSSMGSSINTIAGALIQMAEQVSAALNYTAGIMRVLVPSAPPLAGAASLGIVPVRVVNDVSQPLPVQVVQQEERRRGFIGQGFTNLLGGIGSLIGNLAGGVAGGILSGAFSPITSLALGGELIVLVGELVFLFGRIRRVVRELLGGLAFLMSDFFDQMYKAGILPLSALIAGIMAEVDKYLMTNLSRFVGSIMAEVMTHLIPYLRWLIIELVNWTGELINGLRQWFTDSLPVIIPFLGKLIDYLYKTTVKDLIKDLLDTLLSLFPVLKMMVSQLLYDVVYPFLQTAIHNLYISTIRDLVHDALYTLVYPFMLWAIPGLVIAIRNATGLRSPQPPGPIPPVPPPTPGLALKQQPVPVDLRSMLRLFFPAPPFGAPPPPMPSLKLPPFLIPELVLPDLPAPRPLDRLLGTLDDISASVSAPAGAGAITLNGDINVSIAAAAVDTEHADDVARQIASRVLEEIHRLIEIERFSRGLPANGTP